MKPRPLATDQLDAVGAPWEIVRLAIGSRIVDLYTKDGNWGGYANYMALTPDFNVGFAVMAASLPRPQAQMTTYAIRRLIERIFVPAIEDTAREQADANFGGIYRSATTNSSLMIVTDDKPGIKVVEWISEGTNVLAAMRSVLEDLDESTDVNFRLYPNLLYSDTTNGKFCRFAGSSGFLTGTSSAYPAWESIDGFTYGSIGIDNFLFEVDLETGRALNVQPLAWRTTLQREVEISN